MLDVLEAERLKLARHRAAWWLLWIYPIGVTVALVLYTLWQLGRGGEPVIPGVPETASSWIRGTANTWGAPAGTFGRYMIAAFTAVAFGGEYGWNTWKLIVPHRERVLLMAGKYLMVLALVAAAFLLAAAIAVVGSFLTAPLGREGLPAGVTVAEVLAVHGRAALKALPPVLLTLAYASAATVLTRSTLAGAIIAIVVITAESVFGQVAPMLALLAPKVVPPLYQALPGYHLNNLGVWIDSGRALSVPFPEGRVSHEWTVSLAVLAAWIGGLVALTIAMFRRQDLN